jgi:arogenate dehydrogenase (NADP+)
MVDMTCEEHDRQAASTQFVTHTVGRMLGAMNLTSTEINTKGFEALLQLVANTTHDSFDLYYGLFLYNTNATGALWLLRAGFGVHEGHQGGAHGRCGCWG